MKFRKLLKYNKNSVIALTIYDNGEMFTCLSKNEIALEKYMDREVEGWTADGTVNMCLPGMSICLKKEADNGR
jgi:hypothetical protein